MIQEKFKKILKDAESGDVKAQAIVGKCYYGGDGVNKDYEKCFFWSLKAEEQECDVVQYNLANCYYYGRGKIEDKEKAIYWLKKSAEQGYVSAQNELGGLLL